ncbi:putative lipoprotein with Yx(FWY)xxD motif [Devosia sp. UYZn731]|uniref:COG4315 family predicted lipoprotein n=1 Tax=Devosia sp. UYZn731 TaxID=3156345 RepID=UPI0033926C55
MNIRMLLAGAAALALFSAPAFAEDYAAGAVKTSEIGGKAVLTDAKGMTLYTFDKDTAGVTNCYDDCATKWPPAMAAADAKADGDFTLVDRKDGSKMWAHKGMPLYLWFKDTKAGDTTGDGVGGVWHTAVE